jgi:CDP-paratose 2-epimerase
MAGPVDLIIECSAEPSVLAGYGGSPAYLVNTNLTGAINCFELARRKQAGVIFLSTSRVYPYNTLQALAYDETATRFVPKARQTVPGAGPDGVSELFPLDGPRSLYGATKLCAEHVLAEYTAMYGVPGIVNRCGLLTGPWQMGKVDQGVIVLWMARHVYGGALSYIGFGGKGKQVRDMLHVDDLLTLIRHQIANLDTCSGNICNVGGGPDIALSLCELTDLCRDISGREIPITTNPEDRPADVPWYVTDNTRITAATGWKPTITTREILEQVHQWLRDNESTLKPILG